MSAYRIRIEGKISLTRGEWSLLLEELELALKDNPDFKPVYDRLEAAHSDAMRSHELRKKLEAQEQRRHL